MRQRLLVVDDDRFIQRALVKLLSIEGYDVRAASTGEDAIRLVDEVAPDLMLLDLSLPDIDGLDLCKQIRLGHRFPILMLTARTDAADRSRGFEAGADDYLTKPLAIGELIESIRNQLDRSV